MQDPAPVVKEDLDRFRSYLRLLAQAGLDPGLQKRLDPSDVVQDVFLQAQKALPRLRARTASEIAAWLRKILARRLANLRRDLHCPRRDLRKERSLEEAMAKSSVRLQTFLASEGPTPSERMQHMEGVLQLSDAIFKLPADQRQALVLKHWCDWGLTEIAAHMERTAASVAGLLRRALQALRKDLDSLE